MYTIFVRLIFTFLCILCRRQYSVSLALDELNIPTLHTQHLYEHDEILAMWSNRVFLPSIREKHASLHSPDFDIITQYGFEATMDFPVALYFDEIMEKYPDCKFILTVRENSEVWFKSWDTLLKSITEPTNIGGHFITAVRQLNHYLRWLLAVVNKDDVYLTAPFPLPEQNKEAAIRSYEEHNRRVREVIPADRLLEYDVREGWAPLCKFLEIGNCPTTPFPKTNSARSVQVQAVSGTLLVLVVLLFVLFYLFSNVFQRVTSMTVLQWVNWKTSKLTEYLGTMLDNSKPVKRGPLARKAL